jgi:hypothetical protein
LGDGAAASGGGSSSSSAAAGAAVRDSRLSAKVNRLDCTSDIGWGRIMEYATAEECVRTYAQLCVAFGPGARVKRSVWFLRNKMVMAYFTSAERLGVFSLVSVAFGRGAAALKRRAKFGRNQLVLADGSLALGRVEAASIRFPALEDVSVHLGGALSDSKGFTDARRAPILAKLCTFTCVTKLVLFNNDIAVVPDAIGALTNLKYLNLIGNKIATLPASIGRLTALEELVLSRNILTAVPASIGSLTALTALYLGCNRRIATLPDWIGGMTALTRLSLYNNQLTALPESIVALTNLTWLNLGSNPPLIGSTQSAAVHAWLQALEDNPAHNVRRW